MNTEINNITQRIIKIKKIAKSNSLESNLAIECLEIMQLIKDEVLKGIAEAVKGKQSIDEISEHTPAYEHMYKADKKIKKKLEIKLSQKYIAKEGDPYYNKGFYIFTNDINDCYKSYFIRNDTVDRKGVFEVGLAKKFGIDECVEEAGNEEK
jgi:hypothetical protein